MAFAQEVLDYSEYTLASLAAVQTDDLKRAELTLALQERNPQSKFLALTKKATVIELATLNPQKAIQLAEEGLVKDPDNVDFLMTIADHDMSLEKNLPQVLYLLAAHSGTGARQTAAGRYHSGGVGQRRKPSLPAGPAGWPEWCMASRRAMDCRTAICGWP